MRCFFLFLFFLPAFFLQAKVSFFAVNLSGKMVDCLLRQGNFQPWGVENWQNEETILPDCNILPGVYSFWQRVENKWEDTKVTVTLEDKCVYCLVVNKENHFIVEKIAFPEEKRETGRLVVINSSGRSLQNVKLASAYEKTAANSFDAKKDFCAFPVKEGKWSVFWEYEDAPDSYFALPEGEKTRKISIEKEKTYLLVLLPERVDFITLGTVFTK